MINQLNVDQIKVVNSQLVCVLKFQLQFSQYQRFKVRQRQLTKVLIAVKIPPTCAKTDNVELNARNGSNDHYLQIFNVLVDYVLQI